MLTIYNYGYFDHIYYVLQSIAMIKNSGIYDSMIHGISAMIIMYYSFKMAFDDWRSYIRKALGMVLLINLVLLPTTSMLIKDKITKQLGKVDHIPVAFALPVGLIEGFGEGITKTFEQVFSPMEAKSSDGIYPYEHYGML